MNWQKIILLSLLSVPATLLSIFGLFRSAGVELVAWLIIGFAIAWLLRGAARPFLSGFATGMLMGLWSHLCSIVLWGPYVANNSELSAQIAEGASSKGMSTALFLLASAPMVGLFYGVVIGLLAWGAWKLGRSKGEPVTAA
jgi:hypothetical protein